MRPGHILIALLTAALWGFNFIAMKVGSESAPPFFLSALRFFFCAIPLVFFLPRPRVAWRAIVAYGVLVGVLQFGLLFQSIKLGMPPGLASLVMQSHVFFTIALAAMLLGERLGPIALAGAGVAFAGLGVIGYDRFAGEAPFIPFAMCIVSALCWALSTIVNRSVGKVDAIAFVAWTSLVPVLPLLALSLVFEGPQAIAASIAAPSLRAVLALAYLVIPATLIATGGWSHLLSFYPAGVVAPFALLVPVFGMAGAWFAFGERVSGLEALGAALVAGGLAISVLGPRLFQRKGAAA